MKSDIFSRLPPATALLVLAALQNHALAFSLPRATQTIPYRQLDVVAWPPLPTAASISNAEFHELLRRQDTNTICGFLGGDPNLPATCAAGSHCVLDTQHNAVGCCANGDSACTAGVFTGCVDFNSGPQTVVDPYVYTCQGADVCYKNLFSGGASQFGCGTASDLATTVAASAPGEVPAAVTKVDVTFTETPVTLSTPTTIGTKSATTTRTTSTTSSTSPTSASTSSTTSASSTTIVPGSATTSNSPSENSGGNGAPTANSSNIDRTGAIVGGTISGVAVLVALIAVGIFFWRKRKANVRNGPGPRGDTQYISPMTGGQGFQRLHDNNAGFESGLEPGTVAAAALPSQASMAQQYPQQWQQPGQHWDGAAQVGYVDNSGIVRYVDSNNASMAQSGNVGYVYTPYVGYSDHPEAVAAASVPPGAPGATPHPGFGNTTEITAASPRSNSISQTPPAHRYHYPGQYPAAYAAAAAAAAAATAGGGRRASQGAASSNYTSAVPGSTAAPTVAASEQGGQGLSMRGGGGSQRKTPIASQFTSAAWAAQQQQMMEEQRLFEQQQQQQQFQQQAVRGGSSAQQGYSDALQRISENEPLNTGVQYPARASSDAGGGLLPQETDASRLSGGSNASSNGGRPLWHQQHRSRTNRNQLWM